jgi:mannosyltransferase
MSRRRANWAPAEGDLFTMSGRTPAGSGADATWLQAYLAPVAVTLLGMTLYLYGLESKSLWFDELGTLTCAGWGGTWLDAIRYPLTIPTTPKPPLSFLVTRLFLILGDYVYTLRLPSAFFAILTIPLLYALGKTLFGRRVGLLASFLLAIAPLHLRYAQEARMYALFAFLSILSLYLFWRAISSADWRWWLTFALVNILNLYTHLFALLPLGVMTLFAFGLLVWPLRQPRYPFRGWYFAAALAIIALAYAPFMPFLLEGLASGEGLGGEAASDWDLGGLASALRLFSGASMAGLIVYGTLFALAMVALAARRRDLLILAIMWLVLPVIFVLIMPFGHKVRIRFFLFGLPVYLLLVAYGLTIVVDWAASCLDRLRGPESSGSAARVLVTALLLGLLAVTAFSSIPAYYAETKQNWRQAIWEVDELAEPGDKILVRHIYHQKGVLFYNRLDPGRSVDWSEENVQVLPRDLVAAFPPDGEGTRWLLVPEQGRFLPGGALEDHIMPHYHLLPPTAFRASRVPLDAQLISPTSYRPVAVVQAVRTQPPSIRFWADEISVTQGDCTSLHWETSNIRELYFDGQGVVGQGTREVCPETSTQYTLEVIHRDGTIEVQTVEILVDMP